MGVIKEYKKTATIHALEWTDDWVRTRAIVDWAAEYGVEIEFSPMTEVDGTYVLRLRIPTLEGPMYASLGDFIAKGINNEFWAIKPDIMAKTYQEV